LKQQLSDFGLNLTKKTFILL